MAPRFSLITVIAPQHDIIIFVTMAPFIISQTRVLITTSKSISKNNPPEQQKLVLSAKSEVTWHSESPYTHKAIAIYIVTYRHTACGVDLPAFFLDRD